MLNGQQGVFLREVEHVEDYVLVTPVLAVVDGIHHFDNWLALMYDLGLTVQSYDGQLALYQYAVIHNGVVVKAALFWGAAFLFYNCVRKKIIK